MADKNVMVPGRRLGNYTLTRELGSGGFADVYLGVHRHLETQAAIKVLQAQLNQADQENFVVEARTVARLKHPHIVHILEFGIEDDVPYLVMNYAAHGTLRGYFQRGVPLAPDAFLTYLKQIAAALQYAHDQGLIHRDIKPENMLLDEQDTVFLSDFGIATQARSSQSQSVEKVIGTVVYMSPEQLQGKPRTTSDQYSLAIVVYEWLTGTRPFQGKNYLEIASQHVTKPPRPLRELMSDIDPAVEQVVLTALAKDYHQRYTRVQDFAEALEQAYLHKRYLSPQDLTGRPVATTPALLAGANPLPEVTATQYGLAPTLAVSSMDNTQRQSEPKGTSYSRRAIIGGGLAAAVLAGGGLTWWATTYFVSDQYTNASKQNGGQTTSKGTTIKSRFMTQASLIHTYKHTSKVASATWSKDNKYIASVEDNTVVHVWDAFTGEDIWHTDLLEAPVIVQIAWSPDGKSLAVLETESPLVGSSDPISIVEIYDTTTHKSRSNCHIAGQVMAWSPDSKFLAIAGKFNNGSIDQTMVAIWDGYTNHDPTYQFTYMDAVMDLAWKPDSKELAISFTNPDGAFSWAIIWSLGSKAEPEDTNKIDLASVSSELSTMSWSSASKNRIASASNETVEIWDANSRGKSYNHNYVQYKQPAIWSPDGLYLASAATADKTIRVWNGQDHNIVSTCAEHGDTIARIDWSPDGKYLVSTAQDKDQNYTVRIWQVEN
ncbi:serine/threonine-protein kinase [Ktedonobacter racemifer]|uniref:non-specific serine/threonine protein kinase n=1 Tax=Ktedonobacter racemifer DSM 44963 TaxID=485913 RepID=D6TZH1_KTERA|nr:serine/threonine-protein kinase [Ktedonobacter racemifer]EFH81961.1 serine/threonine protein kinase with WD40 repeats [Ktedonobacter racemifer DSM 44963]